MTRTARRPWTVLSAAKLAWQSAPLSTAATLVLGLASGFAGAPAAWLTMLLVDRLANPEGQSALTAAALASGALLLSATGATAA
jgi:hypothetical protein